jgi:hypothetical protein
VNGQLYVSVTKPAEERAPQYQVYWRLGGPPSWSKLVVLILGYEPGGSRRHLTSIKTKHGNHLNLEQILILALTRIEVLACQKQTQ